MANGSSNQALHIDREPGAAFSHWGFSFKRFLKASLQWVPGK